MSNEKTARSAVEPAGNDDKFRLEFNSTWLVDGAECSFQFRNVAQATEITGALLALCRDVADASNAPDSHVTDLGAQGASIVFDLLASSMNAALVCAREEGAKEAASCRRNAGRKFGEVWGNA